MTVVDETPIERQKMYAMYGDIKLMAMLGATVLSRKQIEFEEEAKLRQAQALAAAGSVFAEREVRP